MTRRDFLASVGMGLSGLIALKVPNIDWAPDYLDLPITQEEHKEILYYIFCSMEMYVVNPRQCAFIENIGYEDDKT